MVKGVSAKLKSYTETVPRFLQFTKFDKQLAGHASIVIKPSLKKAAHFGASLEPSAIPHCSANLKGEIQGANSFTSS